MFGAEISLASVDSRYVSSAVLEFAENGPQTLGRLVLQPSRE